MKRVVKKIASLFFFVVFFIMLSFLVLIGGKGNSNSIAEETNVEVITATGEFVGPYENDSYVITSDVGDRALDGMHMGMDLDAGYGTKIIALTDAVVYRASNTCDPNGGYLGNWCPFDNVASGGGNYVILKFHYEDKDYYMQYDHLATVAVKTGDMVKKGQVIGTQGHSGNSTGSHLHVEVHYGGVYAGSTINWVTPRTFLEFK